MLDAPWKHRQDTGAAPRVHARRCRVAFAAALLAACAGARRAQAQAPQPVRAPPAIRAVQADIAARDLDTSQGPPLNAFLTLNPNAVAQAEALDRRTAAGEPRGPLFCMPVAVKDNFNTYDMPTTVGSLALIGNQPPRDAPFVERLRKAGAIIVGKTNMDEFAMGIRGLSGAGGRVGNAYDTEQSAGGSSSGSAVAVGAGFVPFAVGSDNCGSLRIPAAYNGAVSLRATYGRFDTMRLDALLYPVDGRGGARSDESPDITCFIASASGLPAAAFPVGLDARGMPVGLELLGRPHSDEALVAMMAAIEVARGPLPSPRRSAAGGELARLDIARQNELRLRLGWRAFHSRRGTDLGALAPDKFRAFTEDLVKSLRRSADRRA